MSGISKVPAYSNANGNQLRDAFRAINTRIGEEVVTNIHKITNTRYRHPYRASGRQLRIAFEQLNDYFGVEDTNLAHIQNITDGGQLRRALTRANAVLDYLEDTFVNIDTAGTNSQNTTIVLAFDGAVSLTPLSSEFILRADTVEVELKPTVTRLTNEAQIAIYPVLVLANDAVLDISYTKTTKNNIVDFSLFAVTNNGI